MDARTCRTLRGRRSNMSPIKSPRPRHRCAVRTGTSVERADPNRCWTPLLQETRGRESATIGFAPADVGWAAEARGAQAEGCAGSRLAAARERFGMRLVHFSVQGNHIHLLIETTDKQALARGMQGLTIRLAKALNRVMGRHGRVFEDHYHSRVVRRPTEA